MRKLYFLLIFNTSFGFGQNHFLGVQGGVNLTKGSATLGYNLGYTKRELGISIGLTYQLLFKTHFYLEVNLIYEQKTANNTASILEGPNDSYYYDTLTNQYELTHIKVIYNYDYLSLPLKAGYQFGKKRLKGFTSIGLIPAVLLKAKSTVYLEDNSERSSINILTTQTTPFNLFATIDLGMSYSVNRSRFFISGSYTHSLIKVSNPNLINGYDYNSNKILFGSFSFTLGFQYALERRKPFNPYFRK